MLRTYIHKDFYKIRVRKLRILSNCAMQVYGISCEVFMYNNKQFFSETLIHPDVQHQTISVQKKKSQTIQLFYSAKVCHSCKH